MVRTRVPFEGGKAHKAWARSGGGREEGEPPPPRIKAANPSPTPPKVPSHSSKFDAYAFSPHSLRACHEILSCRSPWLLGVASLYFTVPRNQTNGLGFPFSLAPNTPCTSAPLGYSGCMALLSSGVKKGQVWGFGRGGAAPVPVWVPV